MEWAEQFYARQDEWLGVYSGPISAYELELVATLERLAGAGPKRVLELGAGGGQTAAALADAGHQVVANELVPTAARHAQELAGQRPAGAMTVIQGDFYAVQVDGAFDVVCYWDGFGIGSDNDAGQGWYHASQRGQYCPAMKGMKPCGMKRWRGRT